MEAFQVLDEEGKSYLTKEQLTQHLMHGGGERFSQEEVDETMMVAVHVEGNKEENNKDNNEANKEGNKEGNKEVILYKNLVKLMLDPEHEII